MYTEKTQDINTFTEARYEGSVQLTDQTTRFTTLQYHYAFRRVVVSNLNNTVAPEEIPLFEQPTLVSQFGRDLGARRAVTIRADATKGQLQQRRLRHRRHRNRVQRQLSADFIIRTRPIIRSGKDSVSPGRCALEFWSRTGTPYRSPFRPQTTTVQLIPLPERFFAGGGTSLRGFALNQAGPRDSTGFPVGGQALLAFNQEFRFPDAASVHWHRHLAARCSTTAATFTAGWDESPFARHPPKPVFNPLNPTRVRVQLHQRAELFCSHRRYWVPLLDAGGADSNRLGISHQPPAGSWLPFAPPETPIAWMGRMDFRAPGCPASKSFSTWGRRFDAPRDLRFGFGRRLAASGAGARLRPRGCRPRCRPRGKRHHSA